MKGIVLAGGSGTRLHPITKAVSKQLLPVYDKPMIYYPISVLMLAGIREILIITTAEQQHQFVSLLGDGSDLGLSFEYVIQEKPEGLAQAFILGSDFVGDDSVCLVLGDNIYHGQGFTPRLIAAAKSAKERSVATVFGYEVKDPERYGVVEFNSDNEVISIIEKPERPASNYAVTGLYFYDNRVVEFAKNVTPSERGELEITSVNNMYLEDRSLEVQLLGRGFAWLDTGTNKSLSDASTYVEVIEQRQGFKVACLEEISYKSGWIDKEKLLAISATMEKCDYGQYLKGLIR